MSNTSNTNTTVIDDTSAFYSSLSFSGVIFLICFILWLVLSTCFKKFYFYKSFRYRDKNWVPTLPRNPIQAIKLVYDFDENGIEAVSGSHDSVAYLFFLKSLGYFFSVLTVVCTLVLVPVNAVSQHLNFYDGINTWSMASLDQGISVYWIHLIYVYVISLAGIMFIYLLNRKWVDADANQRTKKWKRTVLIEKLPERFRNTEVLRDIMEEIYGKDAILFVAVIPKLSKEFVDLHNELELLKERYLKHKDRVLEFGESKLIPEKFLCIPTSEPVDAIPYLENRIDETVEQLLDFQQRDYLGSDSAFVTFNTVRNAQAAAQTLHYDKPHKFIVRIAPHPKDIIWEYLIENEWVRIVKSVVSYILLIILFLFWTIPIVAITSVSNLETLGRYEFLKWLVDLIELSEVIEGIVKGILPSLALIIFLVFLPMIIYVIFTFHGYPSYSLRKKRAMVSYYVFLVVFTFFFQVAAVSLLDVLGVNTLEMSPNQIIEILASAIPNKGMFYLYYMLNQIFVAYSLTTLLRVIGLVTILPSCCSQKTIRDEMNAYYPGNYERLYVSLPMEGMLFTIAFTYCVILPIIIPFAALTFFGMFLLNKYLLVYVYRLEKVHLDIYPFLIRMVFGTIIFFQLIMLGLNSNISYPQAFLP
eukprot:TRINITY_DN3098_c0_g1_i3.p1 TRINITY_DN3098_c0_g1~~TRINITY_DN3098_c0_g1_i3.p1  ORF type:complete len:654 (+),score=78.53 TRINITY_DN3098_c0_g1_i3:37-1962(+)